MSTNDHPDIRAFHSAIATVRREADRRFQRLTPPAPRPMPPPDEEDIELSAYVTGDLAEELSADGAISTRRP